MALNALGYLFVSSVFDSRRFGLPQRGNRLYMGGVLSNLEGEEFTHTEVLMHVRTEQSLQGIMAATGHKLASEWPLERFFAAGLRPRCFCEGLGS